MRFWKISLTILQITICLSVFVVEGNIITGFLKKQFVKNHTQLTTQSTATQAVLGEANTNLSALQGLAYKVPVTFNDAVILKGNVTITGKILNANGKDLLTAIQPTDSPINSTTGVLSLQGQTGDVKLTAGDGISINGTTITNNAPGKNNFGIVDADGTNLTANKLADTLFFKTGYGLKFNTDQTNNIITLTNTLFSNLLPNGLLYANASSSAAALSPGTIGSVLVSNGSDTPPSWVPDPGLSGNLSFADILSGSNTEATMTVGNGASLTASGTGVINASELLGMTWARPGSIGNMSANSGNFTSITGQTINGLAINNTGNNVLTIANGKSVTLTNSLTFSGTDGTTFTLPPMTDTLAGITALQTLSNKTINADTNTISSLTNVNLSGLAGITNNNLANPKITITSGTGLSGGGMIMLGGTTTFANTGVLSLQGTANQITVSSSSGAITISLPQNIAITSSPIFSGLMVNGAVSLGQNATNMITPNGFFNASIIPFATTINLGSSSNYFGTLYAQNIITSAINGQNGFWQRNAGALSPAMLSDDFLLGGNSTTSAVIGFINVTSGVPIATIAGNLSLKVPTGSNSAQTLNILNGGTFNFQSSLTGDAGLNSRLYIKNNGFIGLGTTTPAALLQLKNGGIRIDNSQKIRFEDSGSANWELGRESSPIGAQVLTSAALVQTIFNDPLQGFMIKNNLNTSLMEIRGSDGQAYFKGNVGIGISRPTSSLFINGSAGRNAPDIIYQNNGSTYVQVNNPSLGSTPVSTASGNAILYVGKDAGGRSINAVGSINQNNADFAEYFRQAIPGSLTAGDVACSAQTNNTVQKCRENDKQAIIGVISTNPGFVGNDTVFDKNHPENSTVVALLGQVPVKVSSSNGSILAGDYLTVSPFSGIAQKATNSTEVIGKALEDYTNTNAQQTGEIMMLVNVTHANPIQLTTEFPPMQFSNVSASLAAQLGKVDDLFKKVDALAQTTALTQSLQQITANTSLLQSFSATVSGDLNVLGRTVLSNLGVTGTITNGLLTFNGMDTINEKSGASINAVTMLYLQPLQTGGIDMFNGKVTLAQNGDLDVKATITAKKYNVDSNDTSAASAGKAYIPAGKTSILIQTVALTPNSLIFATPDTIPIAIAKQRISSDTFLLKIKFPVKTPLEIDWWLIN